jgi:hypothetical protein
VEEFSLRRDYRRVDWSATARLNLLRSAFAGLVWALFQWLAGAVPGAVAVGTVVAFPLAYAVFMLPFGLLAAWLASVGVPVAGWFTVVFAVLMAMGDPLVWLVHRNRPSWVPVDRPALMNLRLVIFVTQVTPVQQVDFRQRVAFEKD